MKKKIFYIVLTFAVVLFSVTLSSCGGGGKAAKAVEQIIKGGGTAAKQGFKHTDDLYRALNND